MKKEFLLVLGLAAPFAACKSLNLSEVEDVQTIAQFSGKSDDKKDHDKKDHDKKRDRKDGKKHNRCDTPSQNDGKKGGWDNPSQNDGKKGDWDDCYDDGKK